MKINNNRKGSAIAFALLIATLLLLSEGYLLNQNRNNIVARKKNIENLQSYFAARAGIQHVMLKAELLPTQLYDAACFSLGKNPFFDFRQYKDAERPTGSAFNWFSVGGVWIKLANNVNPGPRFLVSGYSAGGNIDAWMNPPAAYVRSQISNPTKYLDYFKGDLKFDSRNYREMNYPYDFQYNLSDFSVLAIEGQRKYNEEAISARVVGTWYEQKPGYGTASKDYGITTIVRIQRGER